MDVYISVLINSHGERSKSRKHRLSFGLTNLDLPHHRFKIVSVIKKEEPTIEYVGSSSV